MNEFSSKVCCKSKLYPSTISASFLGLLYGQNNKWQFSRCQSHYSRKERFVYVVTSHNQEQRFRLSVSCSIALLQSHIAVQACSISNGETFHPHLLFNMKRGRIDAMKAASLLQCSSVLFIVCHSGSCLCDSVAAICRLFVNEYIDEALAMGSALSQIA